jgi:hypothetical protein
MTMAKKVTVETFLEYGGVQFKEADLIKKAEEQYRKDHSDAIRTMNLYVKPEDSAVYYVINDNAGMVKF